MTVKFSLPDCSTAKDFAKRLRPFPIGLLRQMKTEREVAVVELREIEREITRRRPAKTVHYTVVLDDLHHGSGIWFFYPQANGKRRRVHPRGPGGGTKYPQDICADEVDAWMKREGITHVFAETEDNETSPECIKHGKHTRATFIKWWRQLEDQDESFVR
jgi:hypothetical protein